MRWTTGCRQREAGNRFIKEFVWNKRTIRSSWCQIMIDRLYASCIFNSIKRKFLHLQGWLFLSSLWGMVSATEREKSFSFTPPLVVFTVVRLEGFPKWFSSFSNPCAVGHWTVHHLERHALESSTLERILFSRDLMFACVFFRTWTAPLFDLRIFCMRAGLADGHRLDIHAVLNGTKLDTCCSFLRHGKFWEPSISFCWGPFCAPFALLFSFLLLACGSLRLLLVSLCICCHRPSSQRLSFLHLSPLSLLHLLLQRSISLSGSGRWTLSPTECCMPVKVDANNTEPSTTTAFVNTILLL